MCLIKLFTKIPVFSKFVPKFHKFYLKFFKPKVKFPQNFIKIFSTFFQFAFFRISRKFSWLFTQDFNKLSWNWIYKKKIFSPAVHLTFRELQCGWCVDPWWYYITLQLKQRLKNRKKVLPYSSILLLVNWRKSEGWNRKIWSKMVHWP